MLASMPWRLSHAGLYQCPAQGNVVCRMFSLMLRWRLLRSPVCRALRAGRHIEVGAASRTRKVMRVAPEKSSRAGSRSSRSA